MTESKSYSGRVPAAVIILDKLLPYVDFISVGTNDLSSMSWRWTGIIPRWPLFTTPSSRVISSFPKRPPLPEKQEASVICGRRSQSECAYLYVGMGVSDLSMNAASVPVIRI